MPSQISKNAIDVAAPPAPAPAPPPITSRIVAPVCHHATSPLLVSSFRRRPRSRRWISSFQPPPNLLLHPSLTARRPSYKKEHSLESQYPPRLYTQWPSPSPSSLSTSVSLLLVAWVTTSTRLAGAPRSPKSNSRVREPLPQ